MNMTNVTIREERQGDEAAIRRVNEVAFGRPGEAGVVDALRAAGQATLSFVAEQAGEIVGHILFSPVEVRREDDAGWRAVALGPMAVLPGRQGEGIGSALVREGLARCRALGEAVVFVLGHPGFYTRYGFVPASRYGIDSEYGGGDAFMVAVLEEGALQGRQGAVFYAPAFRDVT
jgi:putative acetyltransferase